MIDLTFYFERKQIRFEMQVNSYNEKIDLASDKNYAFNLFKTEFENDFKNNWREFDYYPDFIHKKRLNKHYSEEDHIRAEIYLQSLNKKDIEELAEYFADYEFHCKLVGWNPFTNETIETDF